MDKYRFLFNFDIFDNYFEDISLEYIANYNSQKYSSTNSLLFYNIALGHFVNEVMDVNNNLIRRYTF